MNGFIYVALGGAIGAMGRYGLALALGAGATATLGVNILGSAVLGFLTAFGETRSWPGEDALYLFLAVGVLGAFTTFSAFSKETVHMISEGDMLKALVYILANVIGSVGAFAIAFFALRQVLS